MWPDRVSNPGPLTYESGALPTALHGPAKFQEQRLKYGRVFCMYSRTNRSFLVPISGNSKSVWSAFSSAFFITFWWVLVGIN